MRFARAACLSLVLVAATATADVAYAGDTAAAEALFNKGKEQLAAGQIGQACASFEESMRLDPGVGTKYQLGRCYQDLGRTASAWSAFMEAASMAQGAGQAERARVAQERADALKPKLSRLTVQVSAGAPADLTVQVGDTHIRGAALGTAIPFDPGTHQVVAEAEGYEAWKGRVIVGADGAQVTFAVPALKQAKEPVPVPNPEPAAADGGGGPQPLFWVGLGGVLVGAGGIVAGAVLMAQAKADADSFPPDEFGGASPDYLPGGVVLGSGVVVAGIGAALMGVFASGGDGQAAALQVTPLIGPTGAGVRVTF